MVRKVAGIAAGAVGLVTLAGAGVAVAGPALPATPAKAAAWRIVKQVRSGPAGDFTAVVATCKASGWAFNGNPLMAPISPTAWERRGNSWTRATSFPGRRGEEVVAASATSRSDVWVFTDVGSGSRVLRYNGHTWSVVKTFTKLIGGASVVAGNDVWVFGQPGITEQLGAWHYDGHTWARLSSKVDGGSALSATNVWGFGGTSVYHYDGHAWSRTNVASLLPPKSSEDLNDPMVSGIYAQSAHSVYATGNGNQEDDGGPTVVLHYNGDSWGEVASGNFGYGTQPSQQIAPDGAGGLWLPMPGFGGQRSYLVHYSGGKLTTAPLPHGALGIDVEWAANIPGTTEMLGGGFTHASANPGVRVVAVILRYGG